MTNSQKLLLKRLVRDFKQMVVSAKQRFTERLTMLYRKWHLKQLSRNKGQDYEQYLAMQLNRTLVKSDVNVRFHTRFLIDKLIEFVPPKPSISVLCIGCRNRTEIDYFKAHGFSEVIGIDLLSEYPDIHVMDMHAMSFPDNCFDIIYSAHSLEHSYDVQQVIREIIRVARPGATIIIEVPVKYVTSNVDLIDFENEQGLHTMFKNHINQILWSEEQRPQTDGNPLGTSIVRSIFSIYKDNGSNDRVKSHG
jgi:SAM-dependent methyltransferase